MKDNVIFSFFLKLLKENSEVMNIEKDQKMDVFV